MAEYVKVTHRRPSDNDSKNSEKIDLKMGGDFEEDSLPQYGAIQIVKSEEKHKFILDYEALERILLQDHVKDKHVVVVSVAGAFRKGKSFLLDFLLRYMNFTYIEEAPSGDWMGPDDVPLEGFSWRGGSERDTTGILMWSHVYIATLPTGEKVSLCLVCSASFVFSLSLEN
ncbi:atlastin-like [Diaphorina citri]|uniref:Atlastin-like n=1 Tax=Diaphorina citri TaxID=121845 RepID=A0A3Q0IZN6_DIACI|nr:atlastin-like [Diaphorina citri]